MKDRILAAIGVCAEDVATGRRTLLLLMDRDLDGYLQIAISLLDSEPDSPGMRQLLGMISGNEPALRRLCDSSFLPIEQAAELSQRINAAEPKFESMLLRLLPKLNGMDGADAADSAERGLSLLDGISPSPRTILSLTGLLHDPNSRVRAKAALMVGRVIQNAQFVEQRMEEPDHRVRANTLEGVWGGNVSLLGSLFREAVKDPNNRVAGNALLGLYLANDPGAIPAILAMANDPRAPYRATCAWVMGEAGDPQFLPALEKLSHDLYVSVRKRASGSLARIQEKQR